MWPHIHPVTLFHFLSVLQLRGRSYAPFTEFVPALSSPGCPLTKDSKSRKHKPEWLIASLEVARAGSLLEEEAGGCFAQGHWDMLPCLWPGGQPRSWVLLPGWLPVAYQILIQIITIYLLSFLCCH